MNRLEEVFLFSGLAALLILININIHNSDNQKNMQLIKECYKQTTDSKTMLHRIKCEVE